MHVSQSLQTNHDVHVRPAVKVISEKESFNKKRHEGRCIVQIRWNISFVKI